MRHHILQWLLRKAPTGDTRLHAACQQYIRDSDGDGNDDPATNGEQWLLNAVLPGCLTVFDVGANRGDWTASALAVNPGVTVHCFEPSLATFNELIARRFPPAVLCNPVGLSAERRAAALFVFDSHPALNSLYCRQGLEDGWGIAPPTRQESVELIRLDEYCDAHGVTSIDYLKLDVEGHELDVLRGGQRLFDDGRIKYGQFEYGGCNIDSRLLLHDLFGWFDAVGYRLFKLLPDRLRPIARYDQRLENFQYQNWFFARCDLPVPTERA
jgi:FkbM family methyltransferase